jgi:membrane-associated phospholipid phosphatase
MYKKIILFLISTYFSLTISAQNVYQLKWAKDAPIAASTIGIGTAAFFLHKHKPLLTETDILALDVTTINRFDRSATNNWNTRIAKASDVGMIGSMILPALLFADKNVRKDYGSVLAIWSETLLSTMAITELTKNIVKRKRPYLYNTNVPMSEKISKDATSSFFSGHTSVTTSSCFFTAKVFADMHPDSRWKPLVWTGAAILPATVGFFRYKAGKHYFTDILTGYAVGVLTGILIPQIHKKTQKL